MLIHHKGWARVLPGFEPPQKPARPHVRVDAIQSWAPIMVNRNAESWEIIQAGRVNLSPTFSDGNAEWHWTESTNLGAAGTFELINIAHNSKAYRFVLTRRVLEISICLRPDLSLVAALIVRIALDQVKRALPRILACGRYITFPHFNCLKFSH